MPHGFKKTGTRYVSKANRGDGSTPDQASGDLIAQLNAINFGDAIIIGAGSYLGAVGGAAYKKGQLVADGQVNFVADNAVDGWGIGTQDQARYYFEGIRFERWPNIITTNATGNQPAQFVKCYLYKCSQNFNSYNNGQTFVDCVIDNSAITCQQSSSVTGPQQGAVHYFTNCIVWQSSITALSGTIQLYNSHLSAGSSLYIRGNQELQFIQNCNLEGQLFIAGEAVTLQEAYARGLSGNNFSKPALYNKPDAQDFTLKVDSPHLNAGIGPSNLRLGSSYYFEMFGGASAGDDVTKSNCRLRSVANPSYTVAVLETSGLIWGDQGNLTIKNNADGNYEGYLLLDKIRLFDRAQRLRRWSLAAGLNFNTDFPLTEPVSTQGSLNPAVQNNNVPAYGTYASGSAGRNPRRLTEQFRWTPNATADVNDPGSWITGSAFLEFEINADLSYNPNPLRGTGSPDYTPDAASSLPIDCRWIQPRLKLRNNYFSK